MVIAGWIVVGPLAALIVTVVAGRLLGARRGWLALSIAGVVGFTGAVLVAGALTGWEWDTLAMVLVTLALGTFFTMGTALVIDLLAPVGSLATGSAAGLVTVMNPVKGFRRSVGPFRRYRQVLGLARKNGVLGRRVSDASLPLGVRRTLEQAGGIFVKVGQVASTRGDVLPRAWCTELATLRTGATPAPEADMRPHLRDQFGVDPSELFSNFDWTPMASASVSQVYRATLRDGTAVVVKAQRPGLDDVIALDSAAVMQVARLIERRTPLGLSVRPADLAAEFLENVNQELDFRIEAANIVELSAALARFDGVRIPQVYEELSGQRVLVEEMIIAPNISEWMHVQERTGEETRRLVDRLVELFMYQIFTIGVFHADPHPGNILVADDGMIVLIDLGALGRLGAGHRAAVVDMLAAAAGGNASSFRHSLSAITHFDRRVDLAELDDAIEDFLARHTHAGSGITAAAFEDLAVIIGRFGIRLPRWFGTLSRALVTLEGTLAGIDQTFSLVDSAREHADSVSRVLPTDGLRETVEREAMPRPSPAEACAGTHRRTPGSSRRRSAFSSCLTPHGRTRRTPTEAPGRPNRARDDRVGRRSRIRPADRRAHRAHIQRNGHPQRSARILRSRRRRHLSLARRRRHHPRRRDLIHARREVSWSTTRVSSPEPADQESVQSRF